MCVCVCGAVGVLAGSISRVVNDATQPQGVDLGVHRWADAGQIQLMVAIILSWATQSRVD